MQKKLHNPLIFFIFFLFWQCSLSSYSHEPKKVFYYYLSKLIKIKTVHRLSPHSTYVINNHYLLDQPLFVDTWIVLLTDELFWFVCICMFMEKMYTYFVGGIQYCKDKKRYFIRYRHVASFLKKRELPKNKKRKKRRRQSSKSQSIGVGGGVLQSTYN